MQEAYESGEELDEDPWFDHPRRAEASPSPLRLLTRATSSRGDPPMLAMQLNTGPGLCNRDAAAPGAGSGKWWLSRRPPPLAADPLLPLFRAGSWE